MGLIYKNGVPYAGIPDKINATTVNGYTVESDVPANAKFTDNSDVTSEGKIVSFEDLQGGVPFSEVSIKGANGTSVVVSTCGKNLLPVTVEDGYTAGGVTIKVNADGTFTLSGTTTGLSTIAVSRLERVITEDMILSCNSTITGMTAKATVVRNGETIYLTITSGSKLYVGDILTNVYIQQQESGIEVSGTGGYQLELGTVATEYVPYTGAEYTFTPDSDSYTVTTNIMQQDGANVLSVTGDGEPTLFVIAVKNNNAIAKLWNGKVDAEEGKVLSTNDFTTEEKTKLEGLSNYDDTEITETLSTHTTDIATLQDNITTINSDITDINTQLTSVFQSVSDGKSTVAAAITDKAISTAADASFATMATNIAKIPQNVSYDATPVGKINVYYSRRQTGTTTSTTISGIKALTIDNSSGEYSIVQIKNFKAESLIARSSISSSSTARTKFTAKLIVTKYSYDTDGTTEVHTTEDVTANTSIAIEGYHRIEFSGDADQTTAQSGSGSFSVSVYATFDVYLT